MNIRLATLLGIAFYQGVSYASQPGDSTDEYDTGGAFDSTETEESDPEDKRRSLLKLTRKGKDLIEKSFSTLYEDMKDVFQVDYEE